MYFKTTVLGNIGKDAIVSQHGENSVINFSLCVNNNYTDSKGVKHEKTIWLDCSLWRQSTTIAKFLTAGSMVLCDGLVDARTWQGQGGETKVQLTLKVDEIELITVKKPEPKQ